MAYLNRKPGNPRIVIIGAVALLHGAAIYGLVTGLGVEYIKEVMPVFEARNIPADPPPPDPKPSSRPEKQHDVIQQTRTVVELPVPRDPVFIPAMPAPQNPVIELPQPPLFPPPSPGVTPRDAKPRNNPGLWVTTNDYPSHDLREGNQGLARFSLTIGAGGKVEACTITQSSGFRGLDEATCKHVSRRARFEPATDASGKRVTGSYSGSIRWVIPES